MRKAIAKSMILRGNRKKYLKELRTLEWASAEEIRAYQEKKLHAALKDARENVPYYRERAKGDRLEDFPVLSRLDIQHYADQMTVAERIDKSIRKDTTSGTTGQPISFIQSREHWERGIALNLLFYEWAGVEPGDPFVKLWSNFPAHTWYATMRNNLSNWVRNTTVMNPFELRPAIMDGYVKEIQRIKPKGMLAYVMPVYEFAKYLEREKIDFAFPGSVMTSVATLTPHMRETVERVLQCHVYDRYGSREMMDMACDCDRHEGLHVNPYLQYIEILDEEDQPCPPGQTGRIVVTQLHNPVMPMIRYDTRDYGSWADQPCSCGRNWPMLKQIDGRRINMFRFRDGGCMSSYYLIYHVTHTIGEEKIKKQQMIQEDYDHYRVKMVLYQPEIWASLQAEREQVIAIISERVGEPVRIDFELCDDIPNQSSGKFLQSICNIQEAD